LALLVIAQDAGCLAAYAMTTYLPTDLGFHVSTPAKLEADWSALAQAIPPFLGAVESSLALMSPANRSDALGACVVAPTPGLVGRPCIGDNDLARNLSFADPNRAMALAQAYSPALSSTVANYVKGIGMDKPSAPSSVRSGGAAALGRYVRNAPTSASAHLALAQALCRDGNWKSTEWGSVLRGDLVALGVRSAEVCLALDPSCDAAQNVLARAKSLLDHDTPTYSVGGGQMPDY